MRIINKRQRNLLWPIVAGVLLIAFITTIIISSHHLNDLELIQIHAASDDVMTYIEQITDSENEENDRYIAYALTYAQNENDINELTAEEIKTIIQDRFNVEINVEDINSIGVTSYLFDKQISHSPEDNKYAINTENYSQSQIAHIPIIKYVIRDIHKSGKNYTVNYQRYIVDNPYEILNYYARQKEQADQEGVYYDDDSNLIATYLTGKGKIKDIKTCITADNVEQIARKDGSVKVTYIVKNDKLLVDKIEKVE